MNKSIENFESALAWAIDAAGGPVLVAKSCGISRQSVDKWVAKGQLPRTEYTGETNYAFLISLGAADRGCVFSHDWLLAQAAPKKAAA
ncbi:helix-turn-helix domain-containing protein [Ectopseudomonas hydrolytica]|uniref:hypothetical protein n=1 Tax=Ectopseudomonas hydrolytica TaxID=2493633 RepID=UPI00376F01C3